MLRIIAGIGVLQIGVVALTLVRSKATAVILGPSGVGVISLVDQFVQLVLYFSTLSLPFVAVRFLARAHSEGHEAFRRSVASFLGAVLAMTTVGAVGGVAIVLGGAEILGNNLPRYVPYLVPGLLAIPAMATHGFFSNVLAAAGRTRAAGILALGTAASFAMGTVGGVLVGGMVGIYWGNLAASVMVAYAAALYVRRSLAVPLLAGGSVIWRELRRNPDILFLSFTSYAGSLSMALAFYAARESVVTNFGESEAGLLQAAIGVSASLNLVLNPANGLFLTPIVNRRTAPEEKLHYAIEFQRKLMIVATALALPLVLFASLALLVLYAPAFQAVAPFLVLFVIAQLLQQMAGVHQALLIGLGDLGTFGASAVTGNVVLAAAAWLLTPWLGIAGVAIGFLLASLFVLLATLARLVSRHRLPLQPRLWVVMAYGLVSVTVAGGIANFLDPLHPIGWLARVVIGTTLSLGLLACLERSEVNWGWQAASSYVRGLSSRLR